jgi:hypothetical protein
VAATFFDEDARASRVQTIREAHRVRKGFEAAFGNRQVDERLFLPGILGRACGQRQLRLTVDVWRLTLAVSGALI